MKFDTLLHPQTDLATSCTTCYPVLTTVEYSYCRNSSDSITPKLGQLITGAAVDINEAVHVTNTESLDVRLGVHLPLRAEARKSRSAWCLRKRFDLKTYIVTQRPV